MKARKMRCNAGSASCPDAKLERVPQADHADELRRSRRRRRVLRVADHGHRVDDAGRVAARRSERLASRELIRLERVERGASGEAVRLFERNLVIARGIADAVRLARPRVAVASRRRQR